MARRRRFAEDASNDAFKISRCQHEAVLPPRPLRWLSLVLMFSALAGACSSKRESGPTSSSDEPTASPAVVESEPEERPFGIWPTDPELFGHGPAAAWGIEVIAVLPHDSGSFTQGLELAGDVLVESSGRYGESEVRLVDPTTGAVRASATLNNDEFGEGVTVVGDTIIQLTWREEVAHIWTLDDLTPLGKFHYTGEGWGLCAESDRLIMSNGSSMLTFRDREDFRVLGAIEVTQGGAPVALLNELECVDGFVIANVFESDLIIVIDPETGVVVATVDASPLNPVIQRPDNTSAVLNGIAVWSDDSLVLGGKWWPEFAEVRLIVS